MKIMTVVFATTLVATVGCTAGAAGSGGFALLVDAAYHPGSVTVWRRDDVALLPALCRTADRLCLVALV